MAMVSLHQHKSSNTNYKREVPEEKILKLFADSIKNCFPDLIDEFPAISPMSLVGQESKNEYGDYICINVFTICEGLRRSDRELFRKKTSRDIAQKLFEAVKKENKKESMMQLAVRDVGYITYRYSMKWMNKRIHNMLKDGIDTWAPFIMDRVVVAMPIAAQNVDFRSSCIENMLIRIFDYAGVAVGRSLDRHIEPLKKNFVEIRDPGKSVLVSRATGAQLFAVNSDLLNSDSSPSLFGNVYRDLTTLQSAIYEQEAQLIVFVTPVQQREYVNKCIEVAKHEWLERGAKYPILLCCGYRAISDLQGLADLWQQWHFAVTPSFFEMGLDAGYKSLSELFDCAVVYANLKHHRLAMYTLNFDEMFASEGNTLVYLLETLAIFHQLRKNLGSRDTVDYKKEFYRKECALAVHLVQFTEVIDFVCATFDLHLVCEYIWSLCKKFRSYYYEVLQLLDSKVYNSKLFLCDATYVVMKKCFYLLGISPGSPSPRFSSTSVVRKTGFEVIPLPVRDARPKELNPRFELFSMNVHVSHPSFEMFDLFGCVSLIDTDGVLSDERLPLDKNENGYVSYFFRDWYEAVSIINNGYIFFGNPSPPCSAPFASVLEIYVRLYATTVGKDKCIIICKNKFPINLSKIWDGGLWDGGLDYKRATLLFEGENGSIDFEYIALRDAIDTSMELSFDSPHDPLGEAFVKGHILAYYDGVLDGLEGLKKHSYKAVLFEAVDGVTVKVGTVLLQRSVLAVPAKGILIIEALFRDVETGEVILNKKSKLHPKPPNGYSKCFMPWKNCCFNLTVKWSQGSKSFYT